MGDVIDAGSLGELAQSVASGHLRLDPGTAEQCVAACDVLLAELDAVYAELGAGRWKPQFGGFAAGEELAVKYAQLADGSDSSLRAALRSHSDVIAGMRDLFEAAGRAYREAEEANVARLASAGDPL